MQSIHKLHTYKRKPENGIYDSL